MMEESIENRKKRAGSALLQGQVVLITGAVETEASAPYIQARKEAISQALPLSREKERNYSRYASYCH